MPRQNTVHRLSIVGVLLTVLLVAIGACAAPAGSNQPAGANNAVTAPGGETGQAGFAAPSSGHIAFISDRGGQVDLWVMNADGSGVRRLTNTPAREMSPAWSPDGSKVAYASANGDVADIWIVEVATGKTATVVKGVGLRPPQLGWSADGKSIYCSVPAGPAGSSSQALLAAGSGVPAKTLVSNGGKTLRAWSTAPGKVAAEFSNGPAGGISVYSLAAQTGSAGQLLKEIDGSGPTLSPDGRLIAYKAPPGDDDPVLWVMDLQSGKKTAIDEKAVGRRWDTGVAWALDSGRVAFSRSSVTWAAEDGRLAVHGDAPDASKSDEGIYIATVDGSAVKGLTKSSYDSSPAWLADGGWVVFASARGRSTGSDIWVVSVSGEKVSNLTAGKGSNWSPACSPR